METENTFKTKTGFCHILPDRIVLTRNGVIGNVAKVTVGNSIMRILLIYGALVIGLFYFAFNMFKEGKTLQTSLLAMLGIYLIYGIIKSLNNSATPIIERKKIKEVRFKKAVTGLTRARFEVVFEEANGNIKKRLIMLSGSMTDGQNETEKAIKIMTQEKLLT